jgi:uncharacterized protein (TIGR03437 family)
MKTILVFAITLSVCFGQAGIISTIAGSGVEGFSGDGGAATAAKLALPTTVVADRAGNIYFGDVFNNRVRKVAPDGTITTFAGTGSLGFSGDGGPATKAQLFYPIDLALDSAGNLYIADQGNDAIRKVNTSGIISTIAGGVQTGISPIPGGKLNAADSVALDSAGNIYTSGNADGIVKIDTSGNHTLIAGGVLGFSGDGGPAKSAAMKSPAGIVVDASANLYFADTGNNRIRKIDKNGTITTVAGVGTSGYSGDGGPAIQAQIHLAGAAFVGLALDAAGNLYFADWGNNRIRMINPAGMITTVAGGGGIQLSRDNPYGDGKPATMANLMLPRGVFVDTNSNIYIGDTNHSEVRKVTAGSVTTPPPAPAISANGVVNAASSAPGITANSWITILGTNLALDTNDWSNAVVNGKLPTSLDGVSVSIGGMPAYVYYVSPAQINALAPDLAPGPVTVTVTTPNGTSNAVSAIAGLYGPAFFLWPGNQAVATRPDYSLVVRPGTFPGAATTSAKPGEVIILWGTGFGPTIPAATPGISTPASPVYPTATLPVVTLGSTPLQFLGAALTPGSAGLYQIAVQLPTVADGTYPIQASIGGAHSPASAMLAICSLSACSTPR